MKPPLETRRDVLIGQLSRNPHYDVAIIGGGATGLGVALEAITRGYTTLLVESHDFAKGTSSRATKLVHGGVRYLAQGNLALVREALRERTALLHNAPHLARPLPFVVPTYTLWDTLFYGAGLKIYDWLAGNARVGPTSFLGAAALGRMAPAVETRNLRGGIQYWDGQFDDARLALALARTAAGEGALLLNYCEAGALMHGDGHVTGLACRDVETGRTHEVSAGCVINATGVWVDALRHSDAKAGDSTVGNLVTPSQGVHLVVDRSFWPCDHALLIPSTADGRVLFAVPWLGKVILGTTDTPRTDAPREPLAYDREISFILEEAARYLAKAPRRSDVTSVWAGLRPLVNKSSARSGDTRSVSREHAVEVSTSGLVTVTGGKWTTYRSMGEDVIDRCVKECLLSPGGKSVTGQTQVIGAPAPGSPLHSISAGPGIHLYGAEAVHVNAIEGAGRALGPGLTEAMVRFAARHEYARTVEDVLARRSRLLFLDARQTLALAPEVGRILGDETGIDPQVAAFEALATGYVLSQ